MLIKDIEKREKAFKEILNKGTEILSVPTFMMLGVQKYK